MPAAAPARSTRELSRKIFTGAAVKVSDKDRVLRFTITSDALDRDGEVVLAKGVLIDQFMANPVMLWAHDYRSLPVGRCIGLELVDGGRRLAGEFQFATHEFAEECYQLCLAGFLKAVSIGFRALAAGPVPPEMLAARPELSRCQRVITASRLFEVSLCSIPSNPECLLEAVRKGLVSSATLATLRSDATISADNVAGWLSAWTGISEAKIKAWTVGEMQALVRRLKLTQAADRTDDEPEAVACSKCNGTGVDDGMKCATCGGTGKVKVGAGPGVDTPAEGNGHMDPSETGPRKLHQATHVKASGTVKVWTQEELAEAIIKAIRRDLRS